MMDLREAVEAAFGWRARPAAACEAAPAWPDTGRDDTLWFAGRDWRALSRADWAAQRDAIYALRPEAFRYYLPSVLALSATAPEEWFWPADALLIALDRSPTADYWDEFILTRLLDLTGQEYAVLETWLLFLAGHAHAGASPTYSHCIERAVDTVGLLRRHREQAQAALSQ